METCKHEIVHGWEDCPECTREEPCECEALRTDPETWDKAVAKETGWTHLPKRLGGCSSRSTGGRP